MSIIFKSNFTLKYQDEELEKKLQDCIDKKLWKYNMIYNTLLLSFAIILTICLAIGYEKNHIVYNYVYNSYVTFITTFIFLILFLLCVSIKNIKFQYWISYLNYYFAFL